MNLFLWGGGERASILHKEKPNDVLFNRKSGPELAKT